MDNKKARDFAEDDQALGGVSPVGKVEKEANENGPLAARPPKHEGSGGEVKLTSQEEVVEIPMETLKALVGASERLNSMEKQMEEMRRLLAERETRDDQPKEGAGTERGIKEEKRTVREQRRSIIMTDVGEVELYGDTHEHGAVESESDPCDFLPSLAGVTKRQKKKKGVEKTYLQTLAQKAPQLPLIKQLDDEGFRALYDRYKQYVEECRRIKYEPRTIDYCIANTKEQDLRDEFRYGWLQQLPDDPDHFGPEDVMRFVNEARNRAPEDKRSLCLKTLAASVKDSYDLKRDTVCARVSALRAAIIKHLQKNQCMDYFAPKPATGVEDKHKKARETIVEAIIGAVKPEDFRLSLELEVRKSNDLHNHFAVFDRIVTEGEIWERVHLKRQAVLQVKERNKTTHTNPRDKDRANPNSWRPQQPLREAQGSTAANQANTGNRGKVNSYKNAECVNCGKRGHWFLKRVNDEFVQNCPEPCADFELKKRQALSDMEEKRLKRKQQYGNTRSLLAEHTAQSAHIVESLKAMADRQERMEAQILQINQAKANALPPVNQVAQQALIPTNDVRFNLLTRTDGS